MEQSWTVTRIDRATGATVSAEAFPSLSALVSALIERGIPLTPGHEAEIAKHPDTQFDQREMISDPVSNTAYLAVVRYDLRPTGSTPEPQRPKRSYRCKKCGASGSGGRYPFSTCPQSGYCDDCL